MDRETIFKGSDYIRTLEAIDNILEKLNSRSIVRYDDLEPMKNIGSYINLDDDYYHETVHADFIALFTDLRNHYEQLLNSL